MAVKNCITADFLRSHFSYDPLTGIFTRAISKFRWKRGQFVGVMNSGGYLATMIGRKRYLVHRLAFLYVYGRWPDCDLDHINMVKTDNRICNLREASNSQNHQNSGLSKANTSGYKGVCFNKARMMWDANIKHNGKRKFLGRFENKECAAKAYDKAAIKIFGAFARINFPLT